MTYALWIVQGLLALFFTLGSGAPKLVLPADTLPLPSWRWPQRIP